jgi:hypothetical protein
MDPSDGLEPSTPSLTMGSSRQLVATHGNGFGLFRGFGGGFICARLPTVATTGLHKGSSPCNLCRQQTGLLKRW